jgi:hypothetical protein
MLYKLQSSKAKQPWADSILEAAKYGKLRVLEALLSATDDLGDDKARSNKINACDDRSYCSSLSCLLK